MSLNTAASGLTAAQTGLDTTSNDLANASTNGFKSQTQLFSDIYAANESDVPGIGVQSAGIDSNFSQGSQVATGNDLDALIQGSGFFVIKNDGEQQYTRDGAFQLNSSGNLVTTAGNEVLGYPTSSTGTVTGGLGTITVNTSALAANPSSAIGLVTNLNSADTTITTGNAPSYTTTGYATAATDNSGELTTGSPTSGTYDEATSVVAYDSQGNANTVNLYYVQTASNTWDVYALPVASTGSSAGVSALATTASVAPTAALLDAAGTADDVSVASDATTAPTVGESVTTTTTPLLLTTLTFNADGTLASSSNADTGAGAGVYTAPLVVNWDNGTADSTLTFNFSGSTLGAQSFAIAGTTNDGYAPGNYTGTTIASDGSVTANYSNGQTAVAGKLAVANFINQEGLQSVSGNLYAQTTTSGDPVIDTPGAGQAGTLLSGNLEQSNVSTSSSLVDLIQYQQAYEANATEIQTEQTDFTRLSQI
jgi:flagellar hook protein FlgE